MKKNIWARLVIFLGLSIHLLEAHPSAEGTNDNELIELLPVDGRMAVGEDAEDEITAEEDLIILPQTDSGEIKDENEIELEPSLSTNEVEETAGEEVLEEDTTYEQEVHTDDDDYSGVQRTLLSDPFVMQQFLQPFHTGSTSRSSKIEQTLTNLKENIEAEENIIEEEVQVKNEVREEKKVNAFSEDEKESSIISVQDAELNGEEVSGNLETPPTLFHGSSRSVKILYPLKPDTGFTTNIHNPSLSPSSSIPIQHSPEPRFPSPFQPTSRPAKTFYNSIQQPGYLPTLQNPAPHVPFSILYPPKLHLRPPPNIEYAYATQRPPLNMHYSGIPLPGPPQRPFFNGHYSTIPQPTPPPTIEYASQRPFFDIYYLTTPQPGYMVPHDVDDINWEQIKESLNKPIFSGRT